MPKIDLFNHGGGNKTALSPFFYDPKETPESFNTDFHSELAAVSKAEQYDQFLDDAGNAVIQGIFPTEFPDGTSKLFMATNGVIYENGLAAWTSRRTGLSTTAMKWDSAFLYDRLFVANGDSNIQHTDDGITWGTVAYQPKLVEVFRNRLYLGNLGANEANRFRFSDLADGTTFTSTQYVDTIDLPLTGMRATLNYLFLFTRESVWRWDETYLFKIDTVGTRSFRSVQVGEAGVFFANKDGVWLTNGAKAQLVSRPVQAWIDAITPSNLANLNGGYLNNEYYLWIGDALGQSDVVLVYNALFRNWRILTNWPSAVMAAWTNSSSEDNLYFGENNANSLIYKVGGTVDQSDVATTATYCYPTLTPAGGGKEFQGKRLYCFARSEGTCTFQIQYALNWEDSYQTLTEWTLTGKGYTETIKLDVPRSLNGKAVQWKITEATAGIPWTWQGMRFYYDTLRGVDD